MWYYSVIQFYWNGLGIRQGLAPHVKDIAEQKESDSTLQNPKHCGCPYRFV